MKKSPSLERSSYHRHIAALLLAGLSLSHLAKAEWVSLPLVTASSRAAGNNGGEGCQVLESLACDSTGNLLIATTDVGGLLKSTNGAQSWMPVNVKYSARGATAVGIDPKNSNRILVAGSNGGSSQPTNGLYLSIDQAETWKSVLSNTNAVTKQFRDQIAYDPTSYSSGLGYTQTILWSSPTSSGTIYSSINGGDSWAAVTSTVGGVVTSFGNSILKFDPNGVLYAANSSGVYRSDDKGATFTQIATAAVKGMDVVNAAKVYYNDANGVYVYDVANGTSAKLASSGLPLGKLAYLKVSPVDPNRMSIFAGDFNPICWTQDGGATWARSTHDNSQSFIPDNSNQNGHAAAWHPTQASTLYGFSWGFLIKSVNGGSKFTWSNNGYTGVDHSGYFNFNVANPDLLLVTSQDYNSAVTTDSGHTWKYLNVAKTGWGGYNYGGYAISSSAAGRMFVGNADSWGGTRKLRVSMDGGSTWTQLADSAGAAITGNSGDAACGDPADPNYAFWHQWRTQNGMATGTASDWTKMVNCDGVHTYNPVGKELYGRYGSTVVKSIDHGATWTTVATLPNTVTDLAYDHVRDRIYAITNQRALFQIDLGKSGAIDITRRLPVDQQGKRGANTIAVDPVNPDIVYEGEHSDVYMTNVAVARSTDAGVTWTSLTKKAGDPGLDGAHEVQCLRVHPKSRYLYAGSECFGTWAYPPPSAAALVNEAESLAIAAQSGASPSASANSGASGGNLLDLGTSAAGAYVTLAVPNCKASTYKLAYVARKTGNPGGPGVFQVSVSDNVNGPFTNVGGTANFYDVNTYLQVFAPGNVTFSTPGTKYVRFTSTGVSGGSTYGGKIDVLALTDLNVSEAETATATDSSGDTYRVIDEAGTSGGKVAIYDSDAVGDYLTYLLPDVNAGAYQIKVGVKKYSTRGVFQLAVGDADGALSNVGAPQDQYAAAVAYTELDLGAWSNTAFGDKAVQFKVTGKNGASTGYSLSFDYIKLIPQ